MRTRSDVAQALAGTAARVAREDAARAAFRTGVLGVDHYGLRAVLAQLGVESVAYHSADTP